jgi:hypothetical protein
MAVDASRLTLDQLLESARARIRSYEAAEAFAANKPSVTAHLLNTTSGRPSLRLPRSSRTHSRNILLGAS